MEGIALLTKINSILEEDFEQLADQKIRRQRAVEVINERHPGKYYFVTREQAQRFQSLFDASNEALQQLAFPDFHDKLFDDDFEEYPEVLPVLTLDDREITLRARNLLSAIERDIQPAPAWKWLAQLLRHRCKR